MSKFKEKIRNFYEKHKKGIVTGGVIIGLLPVAGFLGLSTYGILADKKNKQEQSDEEEEDYGRDCLMQFVTDDDKHEVLGEVPCTELYARESIDEYKEFVKDK